MGRLYYQSLLLSKINKEKNLSGTLSWFNFWAVIEVSSRSTPVESLFILNRIFFNTRDPTARKLKGLYFKCYLTQILLLLNCGFWIFLDECFRQFNHSL